ncbi:HD domain-containing protein, partial [bacterium]
TAGYKEIRDVLRKIKDSSSLIDSVYTMVKTNKDDIWAFVVDSGDKKRTIAYCGERYDVSNMPQMRLAFNGPIVDEEPSADKWGMWLSGYAPVYNRQGQGVAIVGIDVSIESIHDMQAILLSRFLWALLSGIILSIFMGWVVAKGINRPLNRLILGVREVGKGNLDFKVLVKSKDEIEELAKAFNHMTNDLRLAHEKLQQYYLETVKSLAKAIEAKDFYTKGHSERVAQYAVGIAKKMDFSEEEIKLLEDVCILHDVGKIGVPENILGKPGPLSPEEYEIIKKHPGIGEEILKNVEYLKPGLSVVSQHHERPDGKGYPRALKAEEINILASIVSVADAYDAMTSDRPYRKALAQDKAVSLIRENVGTQFDVRVVKAFIESLK